MDDPTELQARIDLLTEQLRQRDAAIRDLARQLPPHRVAIILEHHHLA